MCSTSRSSRKYLRSLATASVFFSPSQASSCTNRDSCCTTATATEETFCHDGCCNRRAELPGKVMQGLVIVQSCTHGQRGKSRMCSPVVSPVKPRHDNVAPACVYWPQGSCRLGTCTAAIQARLQLVDLGGVNARMATMWCSCTSFEISTSVISVLESTVDHARMLPCITTYDSPLLNFGLRRKIRFWDMT